MIRYFRLLSLRHRLQRIDAALDRLQARQAKTAAIGGMLARERLQRDFDQLAVTRAIFAHRIQQLTNRPGRPQADARRSRPLSTPADLHRAA